MEFLSPEDVENNRKKTKAVLNRMRELVGYDEETQKRLVAEIVPGIPETCTVNIILPIGRKVLSHLINICSVEPVSGFVICQTSEGQDKALKAEMDQLEDSASNYPECERYFKDGGASEISDEEIMQKLGIPSLK